MDNRSPRKIAGILWCPGLKRNIVILIVFFLIYLALGSATGINSSSPEEMSDILNESLLSQDETFSFGILNILDGNNNPLFCMVTLYDNAGISKVSDFTDTLSIEKINPGSHLNIESNGNNILLDFSINSDSFDPVVRIADYGVSNPTGNFELPGTVLKYVSVDAVNLSYSNLRMAIGYSGLDAHIDTHNIDTSKLKIFKYVETSTYNEWIELPTHVDEPDQAVWTDIDSTSIFAVTITDSTAHPQNITIGDVSLFNSIGIPQIAEIIIVGPEGNNIAGSVGTLTLDEAPSGSYLNINCSEKNIRLDFILNAGSSDPVILLEDFGTNNPAGDYLPPGEPVTYLMVGAENLGYSRVNMTLYYPDISGNSSIFRLSETFTDNKWEELPAVVDTANNTITTSLDSLSIFALSKMTPVGVRVLDNTNAPLTVEIKTYDDNENPGIVKRGHTLSVDELPERGNIEIDALVEKDVAVTFKSSYSLGGEIVLDNYARHNPEVIGPDRIPVKFVEIHARNLIFDSADIEIQYSDDEIGSLDENKLQISHFSGGAWVTLDSTVDPVNNMVKASTDSLSTFALVYNGTSVNTKKSIYRPGETAEIMIVVLDSAGAPVNDASIRMNVTAPSGSVEYFSTVTGSIVETTDPGVYEAAYLTGDDGQYNISCTAIIEGSESGFDTYFMVLNEYDFDIIRHAQSKIDPTKYDTFDVGVDIISYTDADMITVWEYVPADFEVYTDASVVEADNLKVLTWQRSLVNNRTSVNYSYSVPMEWPKLYQLGPVEIDYGNETSAEARPWYVGVDPDEPYLILFWDGGAAPSGWTCISDNTGEDFYQRFPRGNTTYGGTGGATTHTHIVTQVGDSSTNSASQNPRAGSNGATVSHYHPPPLSSGSTNEVSLLPTYRDLKVIVYNGGIPSTIPSGAIAMFNTSSPSGWTDYTDQNDKFARGAATAGGTGGETSGHTHSVNITTGSENTGSVSQTGSGTGYCASPHDHNGSGTTDSKNQWPPYIEVVFAKANSDTSIPDGMIGLFNDTPPSASWDVASNNSEDFYHRLLSGKTTTSFPTTGGSATHQHSNLGITTDDPNQHRSEGSSTRNNVASNTHTHTVTVSFSEEDNWPPYIDVIFAYHVAVGQPSTTSWWNNKTNNDSLTLSINISEEIEFGIMYDLPGNITWNATGYPDRSNLSVLSGNQTYNWSTSGTKYLNASMNNTNGTSSITEWSIVIASIPDAPSITDVTSSGVTRSQAHITWDTNQSNSDNRVKYSIYPDLSNHNWSSWDNNTDSVHILLTGLSPSIKYYYSAYSYNGTNNSLYSNSSVYNFTTAGNATAHGNVKDKGGGQLTCDITVYDEDGTTVLYSITGHSFDWDDVPIGGYMQFNALSGKNVSAKFKINGSSIDSTIILDDYGLNNPESTVSPSNPVKYVNVSAVNVSYESVEVKIHCTDADLGNRNENGLSIYHHKNGAWENLPTTVDAANNTFTAQTSSLSTLAVGEPNKLLVFTDKQVYRDELYDFDTLNIYLDDANDLGVTVFAMVLDDEGYINTTGLSFNGTLEDVELQDHQASSSVHHTITSNPSGYGYDNITLSAFADDGVYPDAVAGDGIFTSYTNVSELPNNISQQHLLINITVNETTSGINETVQVLFTRGGCKHDSIAYGSGKNAAHDKHVSSSTDQTACVVCHWGYEHHLGNHKTVMTPVDVSNLGGGQTWNYMTGDASGSTTTSAAWSELGDSHYCYTCHFSGTTGNAVWDFATDNTTDRPSCNDATSVAGADCHDVTVIEGASLTDIDWKWKSVGAGNITSHNHTDTTPAVVPCEICHRNWHNNKLPNSSAEINDQCTICHSSTGPTRSENYTHDSTSTDCKACHLDTDQVMDPHLIAEAGIPNANCSECHDLGGCSLNLIDYNTFNKSDYVHNQLNISAGKYPLNYNATNGSATRPADDKICWGCHGEDDNDDGLANFSEQPAEHHPNRYNNARTCEECHQNASSNWSAPQNVAHSNNTDEVRTPGAPYCYDCHGHTVMYNQSHQDTDYTTSYKDTVAAHYGTGYPALEALRGSDEYCTEYCHQNTSSPFKDVFVDQGDLQRPKHSSAATRPDNQTCVDAQCHAAEALHSSEMRNPTLASGAFGNANCTASTCHPGFQNHSGTLNCTSCHMDNIGSNIHPIKYLQSDGETFSKVNNTAADCNLCHKETLADAKMTQWGLSPAKVGAQRHSEDTQNGSKWNKTEEPYWTYSPQTITFATGWQNNSERGFITYFENLTWTNTSAARISENTTEDSYVGHFPSNNVFTSDATNWTTSGTGTGVWSGAYGNPAGAMTVYTTTLSLSVDHIWNTSFTYPKSTEVAEALLKLDSRLISTTRLNSGILKEINVSIYDDSGNVTEVYNRSLPATPEPDWIESGEISISNPDTVFWKNGDYTLSIRTRFRTESKPPSNPSPNVRVGYDNIYLNVSEIDYKKYNFTIFINDTPSSDRYELIMGYQTHTEEAGLYVLNNSVYEHKATLSSGALTKLVVPLNVQEYNNGNITLRINDSTGAGDVDVHADYLDIQYMFVRSYRWVNDNPVHFPCEYCHEPDQHYENALGMPYYYQGNNYVGQNVNDSTNWCASCHYQGYQNANKSYTNTTSAFVDHNLPVPPEITGHSVYGVNDSIDPDYHNHSNFSLSDYNDSTCWSCHRGALPIGTNSTVFVHHVTSGHIPKNVSITEITTNKSDYSTNEMVEINITVDNSGDENVTGDLNVSIRRQDGTVLNNTELYPDMLILSGDNNSTTTSWDTTTTPPGNFIAYAQFDYINQTRPENTTNQTTFNITGIGATVQTNESQYRLDSTVNITGTTYNLTSPTIGSVDVNISVYYPNNTLSEWINTTSDSGGNYSGLYIVGPTDPVGTYTVNVLASKNGNSSINSTTFLVLDLLVNTTTDLTTYGAGGTVYITVNATYTNATTANNSQVNLTIKDTGDTIINETSGTIDGDGFYYYQYTIPTDASEGTYSIITNVIDPEGYSEYGNTTFNVTQIDTFLDSEPSITVMWQDQTKVFTLSVENTGNSNISSGSVNLTSTGLNFTIQNQSSMDFTDLAVGDTASFNFNVTASSSALLGSHTLNATLLFDGLYHQKDVYVIIIPEPEIFVRTVTDKAVYLLDPALWVTDAPNDTWPDAGHPRNVTINAMVVDQYGRLVPNERYPDEPNVTYCAHNGSSGAPIICNGTMDKVRTGFYTKTIEVNETTGAGAGVDYLVHVNVTGLGNEVSGSTTFTVDRWGCDDCHKPGGDHGWTGDVPTKFGSVLGGASSGTTYFNLTILTNGSWTHKSPYVSATHESVSIRGCGGSCHPGNNQIECTECHTNYLSGQHSNVIVGTSPSTSCSNSSCHGHLTTSSVPGNVDNRYPNCSAVPCHPISYTDNFTITSLDNDLTSVPQWVNMTTGTPRDIAIHPNPDNAIVNCSFCHNSFHNIYDEPDTLTCGDCHNELISYKLHNGTTSPSSTSANCTECHNFSDTHQIDIHNTITPACSECHNEVNHSSYNTTGVNCLQCHHDRKLEYAGSVLTNGTYMMNTSIHSDYLVPNCTACHLGYSNHSSYDTYGVYCTSCHNNATLDYNSTQNLLFNGTTYNTTYNTNTSIHTLTSSEMIPNCTDCHGSPQYQTHLGNQTNVSLGLAANCTQCHDDQTLNYTGTILPVQGNYNTGSEIHTTSRTLMLPNQTLDYNDNCGVCHYLIYDSGYDLHSGGSYCSLCHYGDNIEYQGTFQDKPIEHSENITQLSCTECHFNWTIMNSSIDQPVYYVNDTMFNVSVHGNQSAIECRDCHTSAHPPPEYSWKWCECCHSYQSDPINRTDRHNVTSDPLSYSINVSGTLTPVLDITDCTACHNATQYNTSKDTFNRASGKDCRYCHTYPDQTYD